jgi:DeoR family fructose operon transcriptional repressor
MSRVCRPMLIPERQSRLRQMLAQRGISNIDGLAAELGVSTSTIRRDIEAMEQEGVVRRTHGGVIWVGEQAATPATRPYAFDQRMGYQLEAKQQIARAARAAPPPSSSPRS